MDFLHFKVYTRKLKLKKISYYRHRVCLHSVSAPFRASNPLVPCTWATTLAPSSSGWTIRTAAAFSPSSTCTPSLFRRFWCGAWSVFIQFQIGWWESEVLKSQDNSRNSSKTQSILMKLNETEKSMAKCHVLVVLASALCCVRRIHWIEFRRFPTSL